MILVYSDPKTGKTAQVELDEEKSRFLIGKKIGDIVDGSLINAPGYKLQITGGSDSSGFPLRKDIDGVKKVKVLVKKKKGIRVRKTVRGNTISQDTIQVNTKIVEYGNLPIDELFKKKNEEKSEEKK
ncbi:MAG: 30S ribosomal protein S6e [Candidatus Micrarchaeia archaeon]|jgi:small subunit ribosomal protein S6e